MLSLRSFNRFWLKINDEFGPVSKTVTYSEKAHFKIMLKSTLLTLTLIMGLVVTPIPASEINEGGFVSLFDGKTLNGWRIHEGVPKEHVGGKWTVEDGVLVGDQHPPGKGGLFITDRKFKDFILKLEVKLDWPVDSGVFLRVGETGKSHQVTLDFRPKGEIGAVYLPWGKGVVFHNPAGINHFKRDDWNDLEIRIEGNPARIRAWLNGEKITDFLHTAEMAAEVPAEGYIALQVHPDVSHLELWEEGNRVRYRNIRVKELPGK